MVDIQTRRIVDILESRERDNVVQWLKTYPNIEVVSRDGSVTYASAIRDAHPNAIQVSDRFHLIKNLTDCAKEHFTRLFSARFKIKVSDKTVSESDNGYWNEPTNRKPDLTERRHIRSSAKKEKIVMRARKLSAQGMTNTEIAGLLEMNRATVGKYINADFNPSSAHYGNKNPGKINPYTCRIDQMLCEGHKFREIEEAIKALGYNGAASTIRMYATRKRRTITTESENAATHTEVIERKWLAKLLYKPLEEIKGGITAEQLHSVVQKYPTVGKIYNIIRSFKELMFAKRVDDLDLWTNNTREYGIEEINGFLNGITRDLQAVKNAVQYEYNNGLAEGSVNKLKLLKRIMYGRAGFELLRCKLLAQEAKRRFK